ncbi:MAG: hypothetical protein JNN07_18740 [Verrucomicrobiales bacterium]|nr:hypothetical protein [Verrucomicrobiales bacterium]
MNALPPPLVSAFREWLITPTLQASVLVLVVLAVQWMFQKQLRPRWRYALWWVVLLKLMLPWAPESSLSVFNWVKPASVRVAGGEVSIESSGSMPPVQTPSRSALDASLAVPDLTPATLPPPPHPPGESAVSAPSALHRVGVGAPSVEARRSDWDWTSLLIFLWGGGVVLLAGVVLTRSIRFNLALGRNANAVSQTLISQFERCRLTCGVHQTVQLIETSLTESPALFGLFRRKLLLPPGMSERFNPEELDYIFLHELAHLKRGDLWQNWLMTGLEILHWFNPMIWWAFARIRADREAACDDLALECSGATTGEGYGETVVKLLEQIHSRGSVPGGVGILEDRTQMQRRLRMILQYRPHRRWSLFAIALLALVGWVGLTDGQSPSASGLVRKPSDPGPKTAAQAANAEPVPDLSWAWQVAGRVLDATSLQPLPKFRVTVGGQEFHRFSWEASEVTSNLQGRYHVLVRKGIPQPALRIEAEGYIPGGGTILLGDHTELDFKLTKGDGPRGKVLLPDGKPGARVPVLLVQSYFDLASDRSGWTEGHPKKHWAQSTQEDGTFAFLPPWDLTHVLVNSRAGWALVSLEQLKTQPVIRLEPFGHLRGTLKRAGQGLAKRKLMLSLAGDTDITINGLGEVTTDAEGRFEFSSVPPATIGISLQEPLGDPSFSGFSVVPLMEVVVQPGQSLTQDLEVPSLGSHPMLTYLKNPVTTVRVPGAELTGVVLSPSGAPAPRVEVAVTLPGTWVVVGRGRFMNDSHETGQLGMTDQDGRFTLPRFDGVRAVVAVSEMGIAQVPVDAFLKSPTLRLEPWAEIHGSFKMSARPASNEVLNLTLPGIGGYPNRESLWATLSDGNASLRADMARSAPLVLDARTHEFVTDAEGRYRMLYVPPGVVTIRHHVKLSATTGWFRDVTQVVAQGGQVTRLDLGGSERKIHAKFVLPNDRSSLPFQAFSALLETEDLVALRQRLEALPSTEARQRFAESTEVGEVLARARVIRVPVARDGTIRSDVVAPGRYGLRIDARQGAMSLVPEPAPPPFASERTFEVPEAKPGQEDQVVELGTIQLREIRVPNR